jgi:TrmH family RNA methyltransferase
MKASFQNIRVVLVRPAGGLNVGASARAMKNTGFEDLVLVDPGPYDPGDALRMAVSSRDLLDGAARFNSLSEAVADCQAVYGVTARHRHKRPRLSLKNAVRHIHDRLGEHQKIALVFGPEDKGLSSAEIDLCQHLIGIPAHEALTSFNLAQAVLLVCHALFQERAPALEEGADPVPANLADRERLHSQALALLEEAAYLTPNRETALVDMMTRLVFRADLETRDVRHLLAIIRHLALKLKATP